MKVYYSSIVKIKILERKIKIFKNTLRLSHVHNIILAYTYGDNLLTKSIASPIFIRSGITKGKTHNPRVLKTPIDPELCT